MSLGQNFDGSRFGVDSPYCPPDPNGAAGPDHFVELINGRFSVYRKTDGTRIKTSTAEQFWTTAGVNLGSLVPMDPRLVYDPTVGRWFASAVDLNASSPSPNAFLLAVSAGGDPTGVWKAVRFAADPAQPTSADFPTLGLDATGVYLAAYLFRGDTELETNILVSIPKSDLLANPPSAAGRTFFGSLAGANRGYVLQPVVNFDPDPGPAAILAVGSLGLDFETHSNLVTFAIQDAGSQAPALTKPVVIPVQEFSVPINPVQPNGDDGLDDGDTRFSASVCAVNGVLHAVHSVQVSDHAAIRWYRIRTVDNVLLESGTIADVNMDLFYPSIAANGDGVVVIGYNACSSNTFVSCYAVLGEPGNGSTSFGPPLLLQAGQANYSYSPLGNGLYRWGDYSTTCVDPADPYRFWTIQMYPGSTTEWQTRITELKVAVHVLSIGLSGAEITVSWPGTTGVLNLEATDDLATGVWSGPIGEQVSTQGRVRVVVPLSENNRFFRLRR